ncbi:hypothetical protein L218DRAFT_953036 [Marasmius fiardii PR-910]|nr:hypothetical protein L218DRAFT_953036 [Marasmius fiardii PR-910]
MQSIYVSLPRSGGDLLCGRIQYFRAICSVIALFTIQTWLLYRVHIICDPTRQGLLKMMLVLATSIGFQIAGLVVSMQNVKYEIGCSGQITLYAGFLFVAGTALSLVTSLAVSSWTLVRTLKTPGGWPEEETVTHIMMRDNVILPGLINLGFIPCAIFVLREGLQNVVVWEVGFIYFNLLLSLVVCRMMVNVHEKEADITVMAAGDMELTVFRSVVQDDSFVLMSAGTTPCSTVTKCSKIT